jgi:hypothetical protein
MGEFDAVPVPMMSSRAAPDLPRDRFPALTDSLGAENLDPLPPNPYLAYALFTQEVLDLQDDQALLDSVWQFMNELALSGDRNFGGFGPIVDGDLRARCSPNRARLSLFERRGTQNDARCRGRNVWTP